MLDPATAVAKRAITAVMTAKRILKGDSIKNLKNMASSGVVNEGEPEVM
jgi:hypothetical protein